MASTQLSFGIFTLVGVIMLVLASASFGYLLSVKNKSRSSWMMLWFFLCVMLSAICTILTNSGLPWDWAFAPAQDAFIILGGVFLAKFAYLYPENDQSSEARKVLPIFLILALGSLGYAIFFFFQYLSNLPADTNEIQAYYLITPMGIVLLMIIFLRRSQHWSSKLISERVGQELGQSFIGALLKPGNPPSHALRNFGFALALGLIPAIVSIIKELLPPFIASFLFNFGVVVAIAAIMLVYLNHAADSTSVSAKLVGISLVAILLILGLAGVLLLLNMPQEQVHPTVVSLIFLVILSSFLIFITFPLVFRSTLVIPLERLLKGVRTAEEGNLETRVEVHYSDEIGTLTRSFNRMIDTLNDANQALKNQSILLEEEVARRTMELQDANQQLTMENQMRQVSEKALDRQVRYEQALANCSQTLLVTTEDHQRQSEVLNKALEYLRSGAGISRAYIFRNFLDPDLGLCMGMIAEACAPGINSQINVPANQNYPWAEMPQEMFRALKTGKPYGGPVEVSFSSIPGLVDLFLNQANPLLSFQSFPIMINESWWGFVGLDDCVTARDWDEREISLLNTASEMIGNTLQRWQAEAELCETLANLEIRVQERTQEFVQANAELRHEIFERQRFQNELENRLDVERTLAKISSRLLSPIMMKTAIHETLADLGQMMQASRVVFYQLAYPSNDRVEEVYDWWASDNNPTKIDLENYTRSPHPWFHEQFTSSQALYIRDLREHIDHIPLERQLILEKETISLLLFPIFIENILIGLITCSNPQLPDSRIAVNIQAGEVIGRMLGSLVDRESLLANLEEKVTERTQELSAFFDLAMISADARQITDVMQPALAKIMVINNCDAAVIYILDEDRKNLKLVAHQGTINFDVSKQKIIQMDDGISTWMDNLDGKKGASTPIAPVTPETFVFPEFHTTIHIALRARNRTQGILSCFRHSENRFNPYQVTLLGAIGEQLGMAVENYRLRSEVEDLAIIKERQRLARELHDAVSQSLYSLMLFARSGRDAAETGNQEKLLESMQQVEENSLAALKEMRLLLYQLRSLALETGGLLQAIETRFNLIERRSGIIAEISIDPLIQLNERVEQELFRLITEALNNTLKHSGASHVSVILEIRGHNFHLMISDNGSGFDPSQVNIGMGLQNMRERAIALGGHFEINGQPTGGTIIRIEFPQNLSANSILE